MLLKKGLEIEQYTGYKDGRVIPLSALISGNLTDFTVEPDQRNVEFITPPTEDYDELMSFAIQKRWQLRDFLKSHNPNWTVVPGSSLALPFEQNFIFSKPEDPYHQHICKTHGLSIITTSVHYNLGIPDSEELIRLVNLMRIEAPLILALSACSPFYDGKVTGDQSYRWRSFPKVPTKIPFFRSHGHYIDWMNQQVNSGEMFNYRHLWGAVRPNGTDKPKLVDRLEVRIGDLSTSWELTIALMAWIETRSQYFLRNPDLIVPSNDDNLILLSDSNEISASVQGLTSQFSDWIEEEETQMYDAILKRLEQTKQLAEEIGTAKYLQPLYKVLSEGNEATQKLEKYHDGYTIAEIMEEWVSESEEEDKKIASLRGMSRSI
jgi:predicted glutamate--cysteine ligase